MMSVQRTTHSASLNIQDLGVKHFATYCKAVDQDKAELALVRCDNSEAVNYEDH